MFAAGSPSTLRDGLFQHELGHGGMNLTRTFNGFNIRTYSSPEDYEKLLTNKNGQLAVEVEDYRKNLFPRLNGIILTIGAFPTSRSTSQAAADESSQRTASSQRTNST